VIATSLEPAHSANNNKNKKHMHSAHKRRIARLTSKPTPCNVGPYLNRRILKFSDLLSVEEQWNAGKGLRQSVDICSAVHNRNKASLGLLRKVKKEGRRTQ
jgi:hypothetical protein